jgi:hypothetical protein
MPVPIKHRHVKNSAPPPARNGKDRRLRLVRRRLASLKPSPENDQLYKPIGRNDPEIVEGAEVIKKHGYDPLVITQDNFIVSGHRRRLCLLRNRKITVVCRVLPIRRDRMTKDEYIKLLRDHNRGRHKSVAEQVREALVDVNPEQAHARLRQLRDKSIHPVGRNGVKKLTIEGTTTRPEISDQKADHVKYIKQVILTDLKDYWPLSVRKVHYELAQNYSFLRNIPRNIPYKNDDDSYSATSDLLTRMRLDGSIPWEALDDETRPVTLFEAWPNVREYVSYEMENLFCGYWRDLLQSQPNHVECFVEKNTAYNQILPVIKKYQIPTTSGRGFNSIDPWHDLYERFLESGKDRLILITMTDWDPEGQRIPIVGGRTLAELGLEECEFDIIPAAVTREQIDRDKLLSQNFAKESSSNYDWFVDRNGGDDTCWELEALHPEKMKADLDKVIRSVIDVDLFNKECVIEREESTQLEAMSATAMEALHGIDDALENDDD